MDTESRERNGFIDYHFIEIGTSDFDTMIEKSTNETGLSIEPIKYYLDRLPNRKNVKKINCAVSFDNVYRNSKIYYITDENIKKHNLPDWMRGCNTLNDYHHQHKVNDLTDIVETYEIEEIPISDILIENKVRKIDFLKIDTEGGDCYILQNLLEYLKTKSEMYYPKDVLFETNELTDKELVAKTVKDYEDIGYKFKYNDGYNTAIGL